MATATVSVRMDAELKKRFEDICDEMGMSMSTAMNIFARKTVREYRIPFEIDVERPNEETLKAFEEEEDMLKHPERYKFYDDVDEMFAEILSDDEV